MNTWYKHLFQSLVSRVSGSFWTFGFKLFIWPNFFLLLKLGNLIENIHQVRREVFLRASSWQWRQTTLFMISRNLWPAALFLYFPLSVLLSLCLFYLPSSVLIPTAVKRVPLRGVMSHSTFRVFGRRTKVHKTFRFVTGFPWIPRLSWRAGHFPLSVLV